MANMESTTLENLEKLTVDEKEYTVADLPPGIKDLVNIYNQYRQDLFDARQKWQYELIRAEAAVTQTGQLIAAGIAKMEEEKAKAEEEATTEEAGEATVQ